MRPSKLPPILSLLQTCLQTDLSPSNSYHRLLQIHAQIFIQGSSLHSFYATHLLKSYAKLGHLSAARRLFDAVPHKSIFLFNALIRAYSRFQLWPQILSLYSQIQIENLEPDHFTLPFLIKACSIISSLEHGVEIHNSASRLGLTLNPHVATSLVEMYARFGEFSVARKVFDEMPDRDVVAWTCLISGCVNVGELCEGLRLFRQMRLGGISPNLVTILTVIPACDCSIIHGFVIKLGFCSFVEVQTAIFDMYAKRGDVKIARDLFDQVPKKSLISWTTMLSGYLQNKCPYEVLRLFCEMLRAWDLELDAVVAMSVIQACAQLGLLNCGEMVHGYVFKSCFRLESSVATSLIDMYAKCGSISSAERVFSEIQELNMIACSVMIAAYGIHGFGLKAFDLFREMNEAGFLPDEMAFLSVLSACSHSGLVCQGRECFNSMVQTYNVEPDLKHYACMVDLLGRAGLMEEACDLIQGMPMQPDANVWGALLSSCRVKGDLKTAEIACQKLLELNPIDIADYNVLMANVYASCGKWDDVSKVRSVFRREVGGKTPGYSFINVNRRINIFVSDDRSHPESGQIYSMLAMLHSFAIDKFYTSVR